MNITQQDFIITSYLFLIMGGAITLSAGLLIYFSKAEKKTKKKKRK